MPNLPPSKKTNKKKKKQKTNKQTKQQKLLCFTILFFAISIDTRRHSI